MPLKVKGLDIKSTNYVQNANSCPRIHLRKHLYEGFNLQYQRVQLSLFAFSF